MEVVGVLDGVLDGFDVEGDVVGFDVEGEVDGLEVVGELVGALVVGAGVVNVTLAIPNVENAVPHTFSGDVLDVW